MFLRQSAVGREPLAVAMSGVRMGERLLQLGGSDPAVAGVLAAKPGLSGESIILVAHDDEAIAVRRATNAAGAAATVRVDAGDPLPFDDAAFDVIVVHNRDGLLTHGKTAQSALTDVRRLLRIGGRVVVLERGTPTGLKALWKGKPDTGAGNAEPPTAERLEQAGFRAVRLLGDRDGYRFFEAMKA